MFLVGSIHDRRAADFCNLLRMAIKVPAANLDRSNDVFDQKQSVTEMKGQFIKQFQILQEIIIRITVEKEKL